MFRNYLAAALCSLVRNRIYTAINLVGLAVGFAAAIFAGLFVRNELTFERWLPDHERIYGIATTYSMQRSFAPLEHFRSHRDAAAWLQAEFPEIEAVTRTRAQGEAVLGHGDIRAVEDSVTTADPNFLSVVRLPVIAGDAATALDAPDSIVITRELARKYFGKDAPIGETLRLSQRQDTDLRVTAVIADMPANSSFTDRVYISSRMPLSALRLIEGVPEAAGDPASLIVARTFIRLKPGATIDALQQAMPAFAARHIPKAPTDTIALRAFPLTALHLSAFISADASNTIDPVRARAQVLAVISGVAGIGLLIAAAAAINFINTTTARAARRAVEVGVRKASGALRRQLMAQFVGESVIFTTCAMLAAVALVRFQLPAFQGLSGQAIDFAPWGDPALAGSLVAAAVLIGLLAGAYPAFVLSSLRPSVVLKLGRFNATGSGALRRGLVITQFAILIGVAIITGVIARQTHFALNDNLRFDKDQLVSVKAACSASLKDAMQALPGVRAVACSGMGYNSHVVSPDGAPLGEWTQIVDYGYFETLGVAPLAGRLFARERGADAAAGSDLNPAVVIGEGAAAKLGYATPEAAIGHSISWRRFQDWSGIIDDKPLPPMSSEIIGVVPDIGLNETVMAPYMPRLYYVDVDFHAGLANRARPATVLVKFTGHDVPETLAAIERLWNRMGDPGWPLRLSFIDQQIEARYRDLIRQQGVIAALAGVALFIATLGLFGLSAFVAERRTKEMGVRKALGASRVDILRLLLWEFTRPVLWANVIAWPVAYAFTRHWLEGYVYHIPLSPWLFLASSALALGVAALTVSGHALLVARSEPVTALRYE